MIDFAITPHVGVGPVRLGSTRAEVHALLGPPAAPPRDNREMYFDGFFIDYDSTERVEFIELARSAQFRGLLHGTCLHEVAAAQAVAFVSRFDSYDSHDPELGYSYTFLGLQLSLWRGAVPDPNRPDLDPTAYRFEAVGLAISGYFTPSQPNDRQSNGRGA